MVGVNDLGKSGEATRSRAGATTFAARVTVRHAIRSHRRHGAASVSFWSAFSWSLFWKRGSLFLDFLEFVERLFEVLIDRLWQRGLGLAELLELDCCFLDRGFLD